MERPNRRRNHQTDLKRFEETRRAYLAKFQQPDMRKRRRPRNEGRMNQRTETRME